MAITEADVRLDSGPNLKLSGSAALIAAVNAATASLIRLVVETGFLINRLVVKADDGVLGAGQDAVLRGGAGVADGTQGGKATVEAGDGTANGGIAEVLGGSGGLLPGDVFLTPGTNDALLRGQVFCEYGITLATEEAQPAASEIQRGRMWVVQGGAGVADILQVCIKNAADAYEWKVITLA